MLETFIWFSIPLLTCAFSLPFTSMFSSGLVSRHEISIPALPERLIVGYANWDECTFVLHYAVYCADYQDINHIL
jgi:hypothetical protein